MQWSIAVIYVHLQTVKCTIRAPPSQLKHTTNVKGGTHCKGQKYDIARRMASGLEINQLAMVRSSLSIAMIQLYTSIFIFPPMLKAESRMAAYYQCIYPSENCRFEGIIIASDFHISQFLKGIWRVKNHSIVTPNWMWQIAQISQIRIKKWGIPSEKHLIYWIFAMLWNTF